MGPSLRAAQTMQSYREFRLIHTSAARAPNKLIFPEPLRCLALWALGLTKCTALRGGARDVNADERMAVLHELMSATVEGFCRGVYPDLYPLHEREPKRPHPRPRSSRHIMLARIWAHLPASARQTPHSTSSRRALPCAWPPSLRRTRI